MREVINKPFYQRLKENSFPNTFDLFIYLLFRLFIKKIKFII